LVEIWVPYGPVEVSFDIKQENLGQILEPELKKLSREEIDSRTIEFPRFDSILVLSETQGTSLVLDSLLAMSKKSNSSPSSLIHTKRSGALVRRKAQEYQISSVQELNTQDLSDAGMVDGSPAKIFSQIKNASNLAVLSSVHYDPMFGLTSAASDLVSISKEGMNEAFKRSYDELPCSPRKSNASCYATRLLQTCPNASVVELVEKSSSSTSQSSGVLGLNYGEAEATHAKVLDFWSKNLSSPIQSKSERVVFGCGGGQNDITLNEALSRAFFNVVENASLKGSNARVCMLAECSQGLGSDALLRYVTGRFTPGMNLDNQNYFEGLEVLLSFYKIQDELELSMISTLPKYYGEKFQFKMFSGAREAPQAVLSQGSRAKITVIADGSSIAITMKEEEEAVLESHL
jgi:hypothetical protein